MGCGRRERSIIEGGGSGGNSFSNAVIRGGYKGVSVDNPFTLFARVSAGGDFAERNLSVILIGRFGSWVWGNPPLPKGSGSCHASVARKKFPIVDVGWEIANLARFGGLVTGVSRTCLTLAVAGG